MSGGGPHVAREAVGRQDAVPTPRDSALAESVIGLYKAELPQRRGPWRGLDDLGVVTTAA